MGIKIVPNMNIIKYIKQLFGCVKPHPKEQTILKNIEQFKYGITHENIIKRIDALVEKEAVVYSCFNNSYTIEGISVAEIIHEFLKEIRYLVIIKGKQITSDNNTDNRIYEYLKNIYNQQLEEKDIEEGYKLKEYLKTGVYPTVVSPEDIWNEKKIDSVKTAINAHAATQSEERILTNQLLSNQYKLEDNIQYDSTQINP